MRVNEVSNISIQIWDGENGPEMEVTTDIPESWRQRPDLKDHERTALDLVALLTKGKEATHDN